MGTEPIELYIERNRIIARMPYDYDDLVKIRTVPGRRWQTEGKVNSMPLDMDTCRRLRQLFGDRLIIMSELRAWATEQARLERNLGKIAAENTADLVVLPKVLPELYEAIHLGPLGKTMTKAQRKKALAGPASYQAADVAFMSMSQAPLNANQPGMGKTIETIASVFEAELTGPQLVIAPISSLDTVWGNELNRWQPWPVHVASGTSEERRQALYAAEADIFLNRPCWVVINIHQISGKNANPLFQKTKWQSIILDEAHKAGLGNSKNLAFTALRSLTAVKRMMLTGTPMGGKPINLFNLLQFLNPKAFPSKWAWAGKYLHILENEYGKSFCKGVNCGECEGGILPATKEAFYQSLVPYMLRRTKAEEMKWLPLKQYVDRWVTMTPKQEKVYRAFEADAFVQLEEGDGASAVAGKGTLDLYTRLRQFAIAKSDMVGGTIVPTQDSCKIPALLEILDERGIAGREEERWGEGKVIVFSQFEKVVTMVGDVLKSEGIPALRLTGKEDARARVVAQDTFQAPGGPRVLCMTTTAGGVAITLDRADTVVFMDNTWNPDNEEQAEDRSHRGAKKSQVTVYNIRTKDTIEDYVYDQTTGKQATNINVLDVRRQMASHVGART